MSRTASGSDKVLLSARQVIVSAPTVEQLRQAQAVVLPLDYGLSLADTADYGLLRLIVSDPKRGKEALTKNGFSAMLTDVLAITLSHRVGQLQELLTVICKAEINVEYMYALSTGKDDASIVLKTSEVQKAAQLLVDQGVGIITLEDIAKM